MKFLKTMSLDLNDHPQAIQGASRNRYLPEKSVVLPGDDLFNIFIDGTQGEYMK